MMELRNDVTVKDIGNILMTKAPVVALTDLTPISHRSHIRGAITRLDYIWLHPMLNYKLFKIVVVCIILSMG